MTFLHTLRHTPWLARFALLWFALTLGVAASSPLVHPQHELVICTAAGMMKVVLNADDSVSTSLSATAHCPLCVSGGAPPAAISQVSQNAQPLGYTLPGNLATPMAVKSAAPPPARAPPDA